VNAAAPIAVREADDPALAGSGAMDSPCPLNPRACCACAASMRVVVQGASAFITASFLQQGQHHCFNRRSSAMESIPSPRPANVVDGLPSWNERLRDGSQVLIRPIRSEDGPAELAFIEALSLNARHNRFLGQIGHPSDAMVRRFVELDF